jgi:hypothetical protein
MGALENTRSWELPLWPCFLLAYDLCDRLGDLQYKKYGVTPEPEVRTKLIEGKSFPHHFLDPT